MTEDHFKSILIFDISIWHNSFFYKILFFSKNPGGWQTLGFPLPTPIGAH
jgi:hypothetical protein